MSVLYIMIPTAMAMALCALIGFILANRRGQFDDLATPPIRVLFDHESPGAPARPGRSSGERGERGG